MEGDEEKQENVDAFPNGKDGGLSPRIWQITSSSSENISAELAVNPLSMSANGHPRAASGSPRSGSAPVSTSHVPFSELPWERTQQPRSAEPEETQKTQDWPNNEDLHQTATQDFVENVSAQPSPNIEMVRAEWNGYGSATGSNDGSSGIISPPTTTTSSAAAASSPWRHGQTKLPWMMEVRRDVI